MGLHALPEILFLEDQGHEEIILEIKCKGLGGGCSFLWFEGDQATGGHSVDEGITHGWILF